MEKAKIYWFSIDPLAGSFRSGMYVEDDIYVDDENGDGEHLTLSDLAEDEFEDVYFDDGWVYAESIASIEDARDNVRAKLLELADDFRLAAEGLVVNS